MSEHDPALDDDRSEALAAAAGWRWIRRFFALVGAGLAAIAGLLGALFLDDRLPAAPLTAKACIDEKLAFIRGAALDEATLLAVGSSATWRNLDLSRMDRSIAGARPLNGATCALFVDQTSFLLEFLLDRAPLTRTVVTVLAPRDFEQCDPNAREFFSPTLAALHFKALAPGWLVHAVNFRAPYILKAAIELKQQRQANFKVPLWSDRYGSSPLNDKIGFNPPPRFDDRCYGALRAMAADARRRGVRLVVVTVPVMPAWRREFDPDGHIVAEWLARVRREVAAENALLVDGREHRLGDENFADPVHLLWPYTGAFTEFIAEHISTAELQR